MKNKYKISLVIIGFLIAITITIGSSYSVWQADKKESNYNTETLQCFKVYFSNGDTYEQTKIESVVNEEGMKTTPNTIAVTNICSEPKELQIRLNILEGNTINTKALTIDASGHIEQDTILFSSLENKKTSMENATASKLIGLIKVEPNETVRTNIKLWFDERKAPIIEPDKVFKAKYELIDTASSIKANFGEKLLKYQDKVDGKQAPNFGTIATTEDGLFVLNENNNKTYYYRGSQTNNYVYFADQLWRIVSIDNKKQVKLITQKSTAFTNYSKYNNEMDFVGLKLIFNGVLTDNEANKYLNTWYQTNITNKGLDKYVVETPICNDTSHTKQIFRTQFSGYGRLITNKTPSLICPTTNADFGGIYNQKVGLITADEVALAGGVYNTNNQNFYLYNGENFYTMTPLEFYNFRTNLFAVNNMGSMVSTLPNSNYGIRPVITLSNDITVSGEGTQANPYTIDPIE